MIVELLEEAKKARKNAYAPYSDFAVGAALLCANGRIYKGCNIENCAYSPSVCAERVALFKAVSEGESSFTAIAIVGGSQESDSLTSCYPCGVCRQVLAEFCEPSLQIITLDGEDIVETTLGELLPNAFTFEKNKD